MAQVRAGISVRGTLRDRDQISPAIRLCRHPKSQPDGCHANGGHIETGIHTLLSEATCHGAIQIPPDGKPIILLNDRQTVGGYPKPGAVIRSDCLRLAQARPGQKVRFAVCSPEEADRIQWLEQHYLETRLR